MQKPVAVKPWRRSMPCCLQAGLCDDVSQLHTSQGAVDIWNKARRAQAIRKTILDAELSALAPQASPQQAIHEHDRIVCVNGVRRAQPALELHNEHHLYRTRILFRGQTAHIHSRLY